MDLKNILKTKIDLSNPYLQGFILGSKNRNINSPDSPKVFDFFIGLMDKFKIPYSAFRGGNFCNNVAYSALKDEWIVGSNLLNHIDKKIFKTPEHAVEKIFEDVNIAKCDELTW